MWACVGVGAVPTVRGVESTGAGATNMSHRHGCLEEQQVLLYVEVSLRPSGAHL